MHRVFVMNKRDGHTGV